MATARENMKHIDAELERVRAKIEALKIEEGVLVRLRSAMSGEAAPQEERQRRPRATAVKPLVLQIMQAAGKEGATSIEVERRVRENVAVAEKTVGSVLSRLKSDGALTYVGEKYYEKGAAPIGFHTTGSGGLQVVQ